MAFPPTATQLLQALRTRQTSACDALEALLSRIERHNPSLNAIVTLDAEEARRRAREADLALARGEDWGPLHGLPVTIKDVFAVAGMRSTASYQPLAGNVPAEDAPAVARLRAAGAIVLGKTNLPALAADYQTDSPLFGRSNNPWDLERTPGGSTGGGAAAIAAGLSYLELGSDLSGSIRIPAHFCGVYAMAPTEGLVPRGGHLPIQRPGPALGRFLRVGPLARSIDDLRLCLSAIAGPDLREPEAPPVPLVDPGPCTLRDLRIAWTDDGDGTPITAGTRSALQSLAGKLAAAGCRVERRAPAGFDFGQARQVHGLIFFSMLGLQLPPVARLAGRYLGGVRALDLDLRRYLAAETDRSALITVMESFLSQWDAWLCPVTATPAFRHHKPSRFFGPVPIYKDPLPLDDRTLDYSLANTAFTIPLNVTGHPAVVIPAGRSPEGLPIGIQVVGRRWSDMRLLSIAGRLSELTGPWQPPPAYVE